MRRLCKQYHIIDTGHGTVRVFAPGMIYDIDEFKDSQALHKGIWAPDFIFNPTEIKDLDK